MEEIVEAEQRPHLVLPQLAPSPLAMQHGEQVLRRRLVAIGFADVANFSHQIGSNDIATVVAWRRARTHVIEPLITAHHGQLLRVVGDGLFIAFGSAVAAVQWAVHVQVTLATFDDAASVARVVLRIGINVDDALIDGGELHGDGVNVAARIHQFAQPGQIVVTGAVRDYVDRRISAQFRDIGWRRLKHISRPVRLFAVEQLGQAVEGSVQATCATRSAARRSAVA